MKHNRFRRVLSALLVAVMVFAMLPLGSLPLTAEELLNDDFLGRGYNFLVDTPNKATLTTKSNIFKSEFLDEYVYANTKSVEYSYAYVNDVDAYVKSQSESFGFEAGLSVGIKGFKASVAGKYGLSYTGSESSDNSVEYAIFKVEIPIQTFSLKDKGLSKTTASDLDDDFISAVSELREENLEAFLEKYGTHILTAYQVGGWASATYSSETSNLTTSGQSTVNKEVSASLGYTTIVELSGKISDNSSSSEQSTETDKNKNVSFHSEGIDGNVTILTGDFSEQGKCPEIKEQNAEILTSRMSWVSMWDFLYNISETCESEADGEKYSNAANLLREYFNTDSSTDWIGNPCVKIITTAEEFYNIRYDLSGTYVLACNIDLSGYSNWEAIGTEAESFCGKLYGNENEITGLTVTNATNGYAGLFGCNRGTIRDLSVSGSITLNDVSNTYIGAVAGYNYDDGKIINCNDDVVYNVHYFSGLSESMGLTEYAPEAWNNKTITVSETEQGIRIVGTEGVTYDSLSIIIENGGNTVSPAYIVLENVNVNSCSVSAENSNRATYIFSTGVSSTLNGCGIVSDGDVYLFGEAVLSINGKNGVEAGEEGKSAIIAKNLIVDMTGELTVCGGNGADGVDGVNGKNGANGYASGNDYIHATNGAAGTAGGDGGDGGLPIDSQTNVCVVSGMVKLKVGNGGNGGDGGNGGNGGSGGTNWEYGTDWQSDWAWYNGGSGGNGGDGGNGGHIFIIDINQYTINSSSATVEVLESCNGNGGDAGDGGKGGNATCAFKRYDHKIFWSITIRIDISVWNFYGGAGGNSGKAGAGSVNGALGTAGSKGLKSEGNTAEEGNDHGYQGTEPSETGIQQGVRNDFVTVKAEIHSSYDTDKIAAVFSDGVCGKNTGDEKVDNAFWEDTSRLIISNVTKTKYESYSEGVVGRTLDKSTVSLSQNGKSVTSGYSSYIYNDCNAKRRISYIYVKSLGYERYIPIEVTRTDVTGIEIAKMPQTVFYAGQSFNDKNLSLKLIYNNNPAETKVITEGFTVTTPEDMTSTGTKTVTIDYLGENGEELTTSYTIEVKPDGVSGIRIQNNPNQVNYKQGNTLNIKGLTVQAEYASGKTPDIITTDNSEFHFYINDREYIPGETKLCTAGQQKVTVECYGLTCDYYITVSENKTFAHAYGEWTITEEPTHLTLGKKERTCEDCGAVETQDIPKLTAHEFGKWTKYDESTHTHTCACGEAEYEAHSWNTGKITKDATCTDDGVRTYTCTVCGEVKTESIPATGHEYEKNWSPYNETQHVRNCKNCTEKEYADHAWNEGVVTSAATHETEGQKEYTCKECGYTKTDAIPVITEHVYGEWIEETPATCTTLGIKGCYQCYICWKYFDEDNQEITDIVIPYIPHTYDQKNTDSKYLASAATATSAAKYYYSCVCGATGTKTFEYGDVKEFDPQADPSITLGEAVGYAGKTFTMTVSLGNNKGIAGLRFGIKLPEGITVDSVTNNSSMTMTADRTYVFDGAEDFTGTDVATFTFAVSENVAAGDYEIELIVYEAMNADLDDIELCAVNGKVTVRDYLLGDTSGDGLINTKDIVLLRKYVANIDPDSGESTVAISGGSDVNEDGLINTKDIVLLRKYVANIDPDTGVSTVVLGKKS